MPASELYDGPVPISGVARPFKQAVPTSRVVVVLGGQYPLHEQVLLCLSVVRVYLDESATRSETLDFAQREDRVLRGEIVNGIDGNDCSKRLAWKGEVRRTTKMQ